MQSTLNKKENLTESKNESVHKVPQKGLATQNVEKCAKEESPPFSVKGKEQNLISTSFNTMEMKEPETSKLLPEVKKIEVLQPAQMAEYYTPPATNTVARFPEKNAPKKFLRSSTQNAITMPLKLPRLANPFPEPVKSLMSHTVSDKEKADLMAAEIKMEQQFRMQQQREAMEKQQMEQQMQQQLEQQHKKESGVRSGPNSYTNVGYVAKRNFSNVARNIFPKQTLNPVEQCEFILNQLKDLYPASELPRKPIFEPGSAEEKVFVK